MSAEQRPPKPSSDATDEPRNENFVIAQRREKLARLRERGNAYPNDFRRDALADHLHAMYGACDNEVLEADPREHAVAGRVMAKRVMGKASFAQLQDMSGRIQLYLQASALEEAYARFKHWDVGDIIGVTPSGRSSCTSRMRSATCWRAK